MKANLIVSHRGQTFRTQYTSGAQTESGRNWLVAEVHETSQMFVYYYVDKESMFARVDKWLRSNSAVKLGQNVNGRVGLLIEVCLFVTSPVTMAEN